MLYAWLLRGKWERWRKEEEMKYFLGIVLGCVVVLTAYLVLQGEGYAWAQTLRVVSFQVISLMTTTGFVTADYDLWPSFPLIVLVGVMIIGGCTGSTSGGIKVSRCLIFLRTVRKELNESFRPNLIRYVGLNGNNVDEEVQHQTMFFFSIVACLIALGSMLICFLEPSLDPLSALSATISCLMNIGPALGKLGPTETFAALKPISKLLFSLFMAVGRLEVFAILVLFFPSLWRTY